MSITKYTVVYGELLIHLLYSIDSLMRNSVDREQLKYSVAIQCEMDLGVCFNANCLNDSNNL